MKFDQIHTKWEFSFSHFVLIIYWTQLVLEYISKLRFWLNRIRQTQMSYVRVRYNT